MVIGAHTSTYRLDRQAFKRGPSSLYNVMYIAQTIRFACLFVPSTEYALSRLSLSRSFNAAEEKAKKNNNTNPHPKRTVYRRYCCSVDTFRWALCLHFILALSFILIFIFISLSLHHFFSPRSSAFDRKEKSYCFFARAHRLTEPNHWTINTNETENNNCYYLDIIFLRKKNTNWLNANHKM